MSLRKKWLYLPLEIINRELDAKLLLTYYALERGYHVVIAKQGELFRQLKTIPKGTILSKGYNRVRKEQLYEAGQLGHTIVELDEEGLILREKKYLRLRVDERHFELLEHMYCWGTVQQQALLTKFKDGGGKIFLTGHPRFDLATPKFRQLYEQKADKLREKYGEFILINTRFSQYNHRKLGFKNVKDDSFIKQLYLHFVAMAKQLSEQFPQHSIVLRPHHAENVANYEKEFENNPNIHVIQEGNIINWNLAASVVIHNGCTTGIEAFLLDKPVISYMPIPPKDKVEFLPNAVSKQVYTSDGMVEALEHYLHRKRVTKADKEAMVRRRKRLATYYAAVDGEYAYERILRLLDTIDAETDEDFTKRSSKDHTDKNSRKEENEQQTIFTEQYMCEFLDRLNEIEAWDKQRYTVERCGRHMYLFTPKE